MKSNSQASKQTTYQHMSMSVCHFILPKFAWALKHISICALIYFNKVFILWILELCLNSFLILNLKETSCNLRLRSQVWPTDRETEKPTASHWHAFLIRYECRVCFKWITICEYYVSYHFFLELPRSSLWHFDRLNLKNQKLRLKSRQMYIKQWQAFCNCWRLHVATLKLIMPYVAKWFQLQNKKKQLF